MPSFISHMVMAEDIAKELNNIDIKYLKGYSLGGDLTKYAKCRRDTHHKYQELFIDTLVNKIKINNLSQNKEARSLLYGHIAHYIMDKTIHPLVYRTSSKCHTKHSHGFIEEYYDKYLVDHYLKRDIKGYTNNNSFDIGLSKDIKRILNETYKEVYHTNNISKYYRFNISLYKLLNRVYSIMGYNLYKISGLNRFIKKNSDIELVNDLLVKYEEAKKIFTEYIKKIDSILDN